MQCKMMKVSNPLKFLLFISGVSISLIFKSFHWAPAIPYPILGDLHGEITRRYDWVFRGSSVIEIFILIRALAQLHFPLPAKYPLYRHRPGLFHSERATKT
jgi:hypothetical protein